MRARVREWMQGKLHERLKKTAAKPGTEHGIRQTKRSFYTDKEELFTVPLRKTYGSATKNLRFRNAKRTVRMAETYVSPKGNIKTMETLHGFLPEVF